ncbi:hypothetical protein BCR37DRAFT_379264 [Protomyces lactucae-debilis]|uniref:Uncharacterized protein n=1 Tax=Protomyces lactucae-debilis TaxID=2754530 RepID=A0A1Y2FH44_PROLT|nr:uncharacterized protein BCR37DRAFT_379264 [Protomyces lactucae-debilis]ORY83249.1 hypothetical protein BCR37DRAFT_379264 [Protomyces lactucae-debilis]
MRMSRNGEKALAVLLLSMDYTPYVLADDCQKYLVAYPFAGGDNGKMRKVGFSIALKKSCHVLVDDDVDKSDLEKAVLKLKPCSDIINNDYVCWIVEYTSALAGMVPARAVNHLAEDKITRIFNYCTRNPWKDPTLTDYKLPQIPQLRPLARAYANHVINAHELSSKDWASLHSPAAGRRHLSPVVQCDFGSRPESDAWWHVACNVLDCVE